jgi:DNA-binding transcriptional LysR family regulator
MNAEVIDLRVLMVFMEVALARSMTAAATKLGLTQSAISQSIRKLETDLGVRLIEKGKRPIVLTRAGSFLEQRAGPLLSEAVRLPHMLLEASNDKPQEARIGLVDTFASTAGPTLTRELMRAAARLVVWSGLTPSLGSALLQKEVDVIITSDPLDDLDGLERFELWKEPFILLLPKTERARMSGWSLQAIAAELPMIRFSARSHTGMQIERHLRRLNLSIERRIEVDAADSVVGMVGAGVGWAIATPLCLLQGIGHASGVAAVPLPSPRFSRTLSVLCRSDGPLSLAAHVADTAVDALRRTCFRQLEAMEPALAKDIKLGSRSTPGPSG